jgi:hypothetical protein
MGITYKGLGIKIKSEDFPSSRGMRPGQKRRRGARGWYFLAVRAVSSPIRVFVSWKPAVGWGFT